MGLAADALGVPHIALQATAWRGTAVSGLSAGALEPPADGPACRRIPGWRAGTAFGFLDDPAAALHDPDDPMPAGTRADPPSAPDAQAASAAVAVAGRRTPAVVRHDGDDPGRPRRGHDAAVLDGLEPLELDIVATVGHGLDPALLGPRRASTRVVRYVPMTRLLETRRSSCSTPDRGRCSRRSPQGCRW